MNNISDLDRKRIFKNLVRRVKYFKSIDQERDFTNEDVAVAMDLKPPYFNSLVSKSGKVTQAHIDQIESLYPEILSEEMIIKYKKEKSGAVMQPDQTLLKTIKKQVDDLKVNFDKLFASVPGRTSKTPEQNEVFEALPLDTPELENDES